MKWSNLPNILTCFRFLLIAPVLNGLLNDHYTFALYLFVIAGCTDALDGLLARWFGWTSYFGSIADPLADKTLLMTSIIALYYLGEIPAWLMWTIVGRDIWIMSGAISYRYFIGKIQFSPSLISKINTFLQIILIPVILVDKGLYLLPSLLINTLMVTVFITSVASFVNYTWVWGRRAAIMYSKQRNNIEFTTKKSPNINKGFKEVA